MIGKVYSNVKLFCVLQTSKYFMRKKATWVVVSTQLKRISQNENRPQIGVNIKKKWNRHLATAALKHHLLWVFQDQKKNRYEGHIFARSDGEV